MSKDKAILYYSTNTKLAYAINKEFYEDRHHVHCTPYLDKHPDVNYPPPAPSSSPLDLYKRFCQESKSGDRTPRTIIGNREGLIRGANERYNSKIIDLRKRDDLIKLIEGAPNIEFEPILYEIPAIDLDDLLMEVPYDKRGSSYYVEYIIENLRESQFRTIKLNYE